MSVRPVASHTERPPGSGSSPRQRFDHARQRRRVDVRPDKDSFADGQHNLYAADKHPRRASTGAAGALSSETLTGKSSNGPTPPRAAFLAF
jgi:hypothetical protein